jgi:hypothetical protein
MDWERKMTPRYAAHLVAGSLQRRDSSFLSWRNVWMLVFWPGLRLILKALSLPLFWLVVVPAVFVALGCLLRAGQLAAGGQIMAAGQSFVAAWLCGTVGAVAWWPRHL